MINVTRAHRFDSRVPFRFLGFVRAVWLAALIGGCLSRAQADEYAVFRSTDGARSWSRADQGLPRRARVNVFGRVGEVLLAGTDLGVFASPDAAASWKPMTARAGAPLRVLDFATRHTNVFTGTDGRGVWVSRDQGSSWNPTAGLASGKVRCLLTVDGRLHAGMDVGGVLVSRDDGEHWEERKLGLPPSAQVFALATAGGKVFAGLYTQGLYSWSDEDQRWMPAGAVTPLVLAAGAGNLIAGHNPGGLHWRAELGSRWERAVARVPNAFVGAPSIALGELEPEAPVWALASGSGFILAGAAAGIHVSEDGGRTWERSFAGLPPKAAGIAFLVTPELALAAVPVSPETVVPGP